MGFPTISIIQKPVKLQALQVWGSRDKWLEKQISKIFSRSSTHFLLLDRQQKNIIAYLYEKGLVTYGSFDTLWVENS